MIRVKEMQFIQDIVFQDSSFNAGKTLDVDQPQYAACRNLLRSGPAASLRVNMRAVSEILFFLLSLLSCTFD